MNDCYSEYFEFLRDYHYFSFLHLDHALLSGLDHIYAAVMHVGDNLGII
jgi:hypothetical protein